MQRTLNKFFPVLLCIPLKRYIIEPMDSTVLTTNRESNMTTTRDDLISIITEGLGNAATPDDGKLVFDYLHDHNLITWDDRDGYVLADEVDTIAAYEQAIKQQA